MINKYTSYITVLRCWNNAAAKHPTEREKIAFIAKKLKTTDLGP